MNKTKNPKKYIERSQHLIDIFHENGINLWCNFIFGYVGERPDTLVQTIEFILRNKEKIGFLSGHGLIAFPGCQVFEEYKLLREKFNMSFSEKESYPELFHYRVNPSLDFTYEQMTALSQVLLKIVNKKENFIKTYAWKWLWKNEEFFSLDEKVKLSYMKEHELPYSCDI